MLQPLSIHGWIERKKLVVAHPHWLFSCDQLTLKNRPEIGMWLEKVSSGVFLHWSCSVAISSRSCSCAKRSMTALHSALKTARLGAGGIANRQNNLCMKMKFKNMWRLYFFGIMVPRRRFSQPIRNTTFDCDIRLNSALKTAQLRAGRTAKVGIGASARMKWNRCYQHLNVFSKLAIASGNLKLPPRIASILNWMILPI